MHLIKKLSISTLTILFTLTFFTISNAEDKNITMLFGYRYPPFYSVGKNGNVSTIHGPFIDFLNQFKKNYPEYKIKYRSLPRARIKILMEADLADAQALTNEMFESPDLNKKVKYSKRLWTISDNLVVLNDSHLKFKTIEDLRGKKIVVLHGNGYGPLDNYFENGSINKVAVYKTKQELDMLLKKRVDAAICSHAAFPEHIERCNYEKNNFKMINKPLYNFDLNIMVSDRHPSFLRDLNEFIAKYKFPSIEEMSSQ